MRGSMPWRGRRGPGCVAVLLLFGLVGVQAWAAMPVPGPSIAEVIQVADLDHLTPSPDGRRLAFRVQRAVIEDNSHALEWHVADLDTGLVRRVAWGGRPIYGEAGPLEPETVIWSTDSRTFFHRALVDEAIGIWRTAADGSGSRAVLVGDADVEAIEPAPGGGSLLYRLGPTRDAIVRAERREYEEGILIDATVDIDQPLFRGASIRGRMATQRRVGRWAERDSLLWRVPRSQHRLDLETLATDFVATIPPRSVTRLVDSSLDSSFSKTSSGGDVATLSTLAGRIALTVRRPGSAEVISCRADPCRGAISWFAWRPDHAQILFAARDGHYRQSLYVWSVAKGGVRLLARHDGLLSGSREHWTPCAVTAERAVCVAAAATSPPLLLSFDLESGESRTLLDPNEPLRRSPTPAVEHVAWSLPDGRPATATLLLPRDRRPGGAPLFLNYYQCPGYLRGGVGDEFPFLQLAEAGLVVACINVVAFTDVHDTIGRYRTTLPATRSLVDRLAARGLIDPEAVAMGGFSFGSEATMWVAMNSGLLAAAAIASPQYAPSNYWASGVRGNDRPDVLRKRLGLGTPEETPQTWRLVSPALNVERIKAPLLMQLPEQEARFGMELYARLSRTTTPVEMHAFPDEGHVKTQPRHRLAAQARYLDWFRFWLQGQIDPDPVKKDQYRRWNELRSRRQGLAAE